MRALVLYNSEGRWEWLDTLDADVRDSLEVVLGDVRDPDTLGKAMVGREAVFHLAALIAIPYSYQAPRSYVDVNVHGTLNVLSAARSAGVDRVIHTSTSEVYGSAQSVPIAEDHPLNAQSPYAASKVAADQMALAYHRSFGLPVSVLRPFNTYGPRQSARAVIPTIVTQISSGSDRVELGALDPTRDFLFVEDTVRGFLALEAAGEETVGRVYNVGSGYEISVGSLCGLIAELMGRDVEIGSAAQRMRPQASEVDRLLAHTGRARAELGWHPERAGQEGLRRGLMATIEWFQRPENLSLYRPGVFQR